MRVRRAPFLAGLALCAAGVPPEAAAQQEHAPGDTARLAGFEDPTTLGGSADTPAQMAADDTKKDALVPVVLLRPWFDVKGRVNEAVGFQFSANYNVLYLGATASLTGQPDQAAGGVLEINGDLLGWRADADRQPGHGRHGISDPGA